MDITKSSKKLYANKIFNGETVNYTIAMFFSFFVLIVIKQAFKAFFGLSASISTVIGFLIAEIVLFFTEKYFVYKDNGINTNAMQAIFAVLGAGIHTAIYQLSNLIFCKKLGLFDFTIWFVSFILIFFENYFYSKKLIFDCLDKAEDKKSGRIYRLFFRNRFVILAMGVATLAIGFIYLTFSTFPFGDTTVLRMDLYHQYGPLFVELFDRITGAESFVYSWTSGGGSSFLGNYFNYLSSPLNIFILLFDRDKMPFAITFLVALKCALSAGAFTFYIKKSLNRHSYASAVFGILYAFSAYMLAYFWNIMWLDGMFILPLLALGIENIINHGNCKLYVLSLIYILYTNYYIGFMLCIFSVIYFIAYYLLICDKRSVVDEDYISFNKFSIKSLMNNLFINRGLKFALSSLTAAGICASFLIPVYFILKSCSATSGTFPTDAESYFTIFDFIGAHFAGLETTIRSSGEDVLPNVYSGVISLILIPLFVVNKNIKLKDKGVYIALLLLFFLFFNNNYTNYIWHAFHFPNDLPYRFSFMYSFILLVISFKALMNIKGIGVKEIGFAGIIWIAFIAIYQEMPTNKMTEPTFYITLIFVILWVATLFLIKNKKSSKIIVSILILAITFCEVIVADTGAFDLNQNLTNYNQNYDLYTEAVDYVEENDDSFFRMELCDLHTRMDPCIYGYNGMSAFSSMAYEEYSRLQYTLGMYGNRINSYTYNTQTPVYNMMYNIKYLIYHNEDTKPSVNLYTKNHEIADGEAIIYENDYYLPIAYCVSDNINLWIPEEGNPFEAQEDFFNLASGFDGVFAEAEFTNCLYDNFFGSEITENGTYWLSKGSDLSSASLTLTAKSNGNMYLYITSKEVKTITCEAKGNVIIQNIDTPYILDLGYFEAGEEAEITLESASEKDEACIELYAYTVNSDILNAGYEKLNESALNITKHTDRKIIGTVNAQENSVLYSSIPYDEGWSVYIDGEKVTTFEIGKSLLGVDITAGEHEIEYKYTPKGLSYSVLISATTLIITGIYIFLYKNKKKVK